MTEQGQYLVENVSAELRKMFEGIATLARHGAVEAEDPTLNIMDKARGAHARVALIMNDAMRGLADVNHSMFIGIVMVASSAPD